MKTTYRDLAYSMTCISFVAMLFISQRWYRASHRLLKEHRIEKKFGKRNFTISFKIDVCGIGPEMLKAGGEVTIHWLVSLFNLVWEKGEAPRDWRDATIVLIHKKGVEWSAPTIEESA